MEFSVELGLWAVTVAGPCVVSWMAGDLAGAARMRRVYAACSAGNGIGRDPGALMVEQWRLDDEARRLTARASTDRASDGLDAVAGLHNQTDDDDQHRSDRDSVFASMPALCEVRAEAEAIRASETAALRNAFARQGVPAGNAALQGTVLRHYENAIEALSIEQADASLPAPAPAPAAQPASTSVSTSVRV